jgi:hypothetical protein
MPLPSGMASSQERMGAVRCKLSLADGGGIIGRCSQGHVTIHHDQQKENQTDGAVEIMHGMFLFSGKKRRKPLRVCLKIRRWRVAGDFLTGQGGRAAAIPVEGLSRPDERRAVEKDTQPLGREQERPSRSVACSVTDANKSHTRHGGFQALFKDNPANKTNSRVRFHFHSHTARNYMRSLM